jgi:hypothetical protein
MLTAALDPVETPSPPAKKTKAVARYADGRLIKGYTYDFHPARPRFHVFPDPSVVESPTRVVLEDLKAVFFVRDHAGDARYNERKHFLRGEQPGPRHVEVAFRDGEVLVGIAEDFKPGGAGFFLTPVDPRSNNLRVFVVDRAMRGVRFLGAVEPVRRATRSRPEKPAPRPLSLPRRLLAWLAS